MGQDLAPTGFCERQRHRFIEITTPKERKQHGQFFTPLKIVRFMARIAPMRTKGFRLLDPGAGTGMLACAVCEQAAANGTVRRIHIDAFEDDERLVDLLEESLEFAKKWLERRSVDLHYTILSDDFVLAHARTLWSSNSTGYDLVISNPPYFKIGKSDPRAKENLELVYGQPNIYALFMGVAAQLLREEGVMVFITPRSYTAGPYFKAFRKRFLGLMRPERVHVFKSRKEAFRAHDVLQENIILVARKQGSSPTVRISTSQGAGDVDQAQTYGIPVLRALHSSKNGDVVFRVPTNEEESAILETVDSWPGTLHKYGMEISTGPVVPFRARDLITADTQEHEPWVPLLWMRHVRPMEVRWPLSENKNGKEKRERILDHPVSRGRRLLVTNTNMVLLRRFSAKEEVRRLVAAPLLKGRLPFDAIGIENHLNYIYRLKGSLSQIETLGLAALLNSSVLDKYFRISNGNTQVSATELRAMPLPPMEVLCGLGERIRDLSGAPTLEEIDALVDRALGLAEPS